MKTVINLLVILTMVIYFQACGDSNKISGSSVVGGTSVSNPALSSAAQTFRQLIVDGGSYAKIYSYGEFSYYDSRNGSFKREFDVQDNEFQREDGLTTITQVRDLLLNIMDTSESCESLNGSDYIFECKKGNFSYFIDLNYPIEANPTSVVEYSSSSSNQTYSGWFNYGGTDNNYIVYQYYIQYYFWN